MRKARFDVLGLGCTAVDDLLYVDHYPPADSKLSVRGRDRQCGGLTATALVAAARLGARCAYAGVLGRDPDSNFVLDTLRREGIHTRHVTRHPNARPVRSVVVVDRHTGSRTILYDTQHVVGAPPDGVSARLVGSARVLFVDRFGMTGMIRSAALARAAGVPVVADLETTDTPQLRQLLALIDHLIVSKEYAQTFTGTRHPAKAAKQLLDHGHEVVVVTCGDQGCWFGDRHTSALHHLPAFQVNVVDTTGCGDVFHGAYAAALAQGASVENRVMFAAAAAALKAARLGGPSGIPTRTAVETFLHRHRK